MLQIKSASRLVPDVSQKARNIYFLQVTCQTWIKGPRLLKTAWRKKILPPVYFICYYEIHTCSNVTEAAPSAVLTQAGRHGIIDGFVPLQEGGGRLSPTLATGKSTLYCLGLGGIAILSWTVSDLCLSSALHWSGRKQGRMDELWFTELRCDKNRISRDIRRRTWFVKLVGTLQPFVLAKRTSVIDNTTVHFKPKHCACQTMTISLEKKGVVFLSILFLLFPVKFK